MAERQTSRGRIGPGYQVGQLTVESDSGERKNGYIVWTCRCSCGNRIHVDGRKLLRGTVQDCGCKTKLKCGQKDITGQRFGMLTAQYCTGETGMGGSYIWHLRCDCGGEIDAPLCQLRSGYRKSCGCLSHPPLKDWIGKRFGRLTVTEYAGKWDGSHYWKCRCDCGREIVARQSNLQIGHTLSCGCLPAEMMKKNLKLVDGTSVAILERRRNHVNVNNRSGHSGVYQVQRTGMWCAQIDFKGKRYFLGAFRDKEDAVKARERAEEVYDDFIDWYYGEYLPSAKEEEAEGTSAWQRNKQAM